MYNQMTKITRDAFHGKKFTGERDNTDHRRLNPRKKQRRNNTQSPRTREGQTFPGGKALRRALKKLSARRAAFVSKGGYHQAGSMK